MELALLPFLNLDAATALALPLALVKARAQFRLCFRLPNGDEEWLLARLCAITPSSRGERFHYCVVLRPEKAESNLIFVAENLRYRAGHRELNNWMTPAQAELWNWDLFEQSFNDKARRLARFYKVKEYAQNTLLKFGADGRGAIFEDASEGKTARESERFIWQRSRRGISHEIADMQFLRIKQHNFRRKVRALWNDANGPIQTARRWMQLTDEQKSAIAFQCERGDWTQLREVASWVLTLYASRSQATSDN